MATWDTALWEADVSGVPRGDRRSGEYRRYCPDTVDGASLTIEPALSQRVATVERDIRALNGPGAQALAGIARFLVRSEAIASSRIEGIAPSAQQVALAELGQTEHVRGVSEQARLVAANMTTVRRSTSELVDAELVTVEHILALHRDLLADQPRHHGLRIVQNWIGGSDWSPHGALFVPPAAERVPALMADLVDYLNGAAHAPLVQAAIVHAQFETLHPFTDGNGRVGRALIHTVLTRRGLTSQAVLPVSLVLSTLRDRYIAGLDAYRHDNAPGSPEAVRAMNVWLSEFVEAAAVAVERSRELIDQIEQLRSEWQQRLAAQRRSVGLRETPRTDSASARLLDQLTEMPVVTAGTLTSILGISFPAAHAGLEELRSAGILHAKSIERGATAYMARDVLDLITNTERVLASTQFDTRLAPPKRPAPGRPGR